MALTKDQLIADIAESIAAPKATAKNALEQLGQIVADQFLTERLLPAFSEIYIFVTTEQHLLLLGDRCCKAVGDPARQAVVAYNPQRQQPIAVVVGKLCEVVPVKLSVPMLGIEIQDFNVLIGKSAHGSSLKFDHDLAR